MVRKRTYLATLAVIAALGLTAFMWGRQADAESHVLKGNKVVVWKDFLGVNAQFLWFSPTLYQLQIDRLKALGLQWVRLDLHWDQLEPAAGQYQIATLDQLVGKLQDNQLKSVFYLVGSAPSSPPHRPARRIRTSIRPRTRTSSPTAWHCSRSATPAWMPGKSGMSPTCSGFGARQLTRQATPAC